MGPVRPNAKRASTRLVAEKHARPLPAIHPGPISTRRHDLRSPENCLPEVQVDFAELENGSLVEIVESPMDPNQTLLAISRRGRIRLAEKVKDRERILVPIPRDTLGLSDVMLPRGVMAYKSVTQLMNSLNLFIRRVIDVPDDYAALLSAFILYTWVADRLPTAVYLSIVGLPQSGKSTLLELLSLVCRRALLASDITQAAAYQACIKFSPVLLIDEIDWHSSGTMRNFRQLLRAGTGHSSRALRFKQESSTSFGPKAFGSLEASSDSALNSRCIQLAMAETNNCELLKPSDPSILELADNLRQRLLRFRFNSYNSIRPAQVQDAEQLRPRSRDLLASLAAPLIRSQLYTRFLFEFIKTKHDPVTRDTLDAGREALNASVWSVVHRAREITAVRVGGESGLSKTTNILLAEEGKSLITDKAVGRMLVSLGYRSTKRTNAGWWLLIDSATVARCHELYHIYRNKYVQISEFARHSDTCSLCQALLSSTKS